jgi:Copper transport outer membrane protein, MctB
MGYSARYHAASLAAVFLALAVGILIGAGLGEGVLSTTEESLRESLEGDVVEARRESSEVATELAREREFSESAYPLLVEGRMRGERIGVVALGELPGAVGNEIESALEPTGAELAEVSVVRVPPDVSSLADELSEGRFAAIEQDPGELEELGRRIALQLVTGQGKLLDRTRQTVLTRSSGPTSRVDRVVLVRQVPAELEGEERAAADSLEAGLLAGLSESGIPSVAVELIETEPSSLGPFISNGISTVDHVDVAAGKVSMVFALLGAAGDFGVKESADSLLPELLQPAAQPQPGA